MEKEKNKVKKAKRNKVNYQTTEQEEIKKFLIVVLVVILCVGAIYLCTRAFVTKDLFSKNEEAEQVTPGTINENVAIMGQLLNRPYNEYYAVIYNATGKFSVDMSQLVTKYNSKEKHLHIYTIYLDNSMNADYYDPENVNEKAQSVSDIKVGDITLVKVKNGKIDKYIVDYSKMQKELGIE
mgnify:CR=1 FL=1